MKFLVQKGSTSYRLGVFVQNSSSTVGAGLTGLLWNSASLSWYYWREDAGNVGGTAVTLATMTRGTWASGGFIEKDGTNMPGFYEIGIPDAALATGAKWVNMVLRGATNMAPVPLEIQLVDFDPEDAVRMGLTGLVSTAITTGAVATDGGNTSSTFKTDRTETVDDYWKDAFVVLTSGVLAGQVKKISAYNGTTKFITVSVPFTATPADAVTFAIINR